jgi:hypothetical protein
VLARQVLSIFEGVANNHFETSQGGMTMSSDKISYWRVWSIER